MTRKDSEKDAERPHYYSQFWLDIAAGRRVIGGPKPEEADANEVEEAPEPASTRKVGRNSAADGYQDAHAVVEPAVEEEEEEFEQEDTVDEADLPNIVLDDVVEEEEPVEDIIDEDYIEEEEEPEEEEEFFEDEEDEEDDDWNRRGGAD